MHLGRRLPAIEALNFHVDGMIAEGLPIPGPSELTTIMADPQNRDAYAFLVDVATKKEKAVRVNFSILESILARIDATATSLGLTRSAFLAASAMEKVREHEEESGAADGGNSG